MMACMKNVPLTLTLLSTISSHLDIPTASNHRRILINTFALCARMLVTIAIGVYASRVLLKGLGVTDYGIYHVVAGIIAFFSFIDASLVNGTQRYLNYYMGKADEAMVRKVFATSVQIFSAIALVVLVLGETVGLYVVNAVLCVPEERMWAANWVFQCTVFSAIVNLVSMPYHALIIAYERMTVFAYVAIAQSVAILGVSVAVCYCPFDRLVAYALLMVMVLLMVRLFYGWYCKRHIATVGYARQVDWPLAKEMTAFSGWSLTGTLAYMTYTQGIPVLLNVFFGPTVNAANALAQQVNASLSTFSANFMMAVKPQITKSYANGDREEMLNMVMGSSKCSVLIMLMIALPFLVYPDYILSLWLEEVPDMTTLLMCLVLWISIVNSLAMPVITAVQATGRVKYFQLAEALVLFMVLPLAYGMLRCGYGAGSVYGVLLVMVAIAQGVRVVFMERYLHVGSMLYLRNILLRMTLVTAVSYLLMREVAGRLGDGLVSLAIVVLLVVTVVPVVFVLLGLSRKEWAYIRALVKKRKNRKQ